MPTFSRRPAFPDDTDYARRVHHRAYRDVVVRQFGAWDEAVQDRFFDVDWHRSLNRYVILLCDGKPCGYHSHEELPDHIQCGELVVDPGFQGRGIGTWVLSELLDRGRARGMPVKIGALHQNRALELYRRMGFKHVGATETHTCLQWSPEPA